MKQFGRAIGLVTCVIPLIAWGCGSGGAPPVESSTTEANVKGTVKIRGKLATKGTVTFDPANIQRKFATARTAPIGKDGSYSLTTLIGENNVAVDSPEVARDPELDYSFKTFIVEEGENTIDIELPFAQP